MNDEILLAFSSIATMLLLASINRSFKRTPSLPEIIRTPPSLFCGAGFVISSPTSSTVTEPAALAPAFASPLAFAAGLAFSAAFCAHDTVPPNTSVNPATRASVLINHAPVG